MCCATRAHRGTRRSAAAERADFEALLEPDRWSGRARRLDVDDLAPILVLADPVGGGGFETTTLQYADGRPADPIAFLTLNYLVRLWRRLGWSLAETDRALQVVPAHRSRPAHRRDARARDGQRPARPEPAGRAAHDICTGDRTELLELWSDLHRRPATRAVPGAGHPAIAPVFDDPLGRYLEYLDGGSSAFRWDPAPPETRSRNVGLAAHVGTVQAALRLSADDVDAILADAGTTLEAAPLDMATVSLLHRYGVLARRLRMPVAELIALRQLAGARPVRCRRRPGRCRRWRTTTPQTTVSVRRDGPRRPRRRAAVDRAGLPAAPPLRPGRAVPHRRRSRRSR